jgi:hypothetical protein
MRHGHNLAFHGDVKFLQPTKSTPTKATTMGQVKKALMDMEAECNGHVHPLFAQMLSAFQPIQQRQPTISPASETNPYEPTTIYGLYVNGILACTYLHKDTAEYECWVSRIGEEISGADAVNQYTVAPLPMHTHKPD